MVYCFDLGVNIAETYTASYANSTMRIRLQLVKKDALFLHKNVTADSIAQSDAAWHANSTGTRQEGCIVPEQERDSK